MRSRCFLQPGTVLIHRRLALSSLGWDVLATDIPYVVSSVLTKNVESNASGLPGRIQIRELDWTIPPDQWVWDNPVAITPGSISPPSLDSSLLIPPFDLICSADTVYTPSLNKHLLRTLHALSTLSLAASGSSRPPPIYLCIERRDPTVIDGLLLDAKDTWGFNVEQVPRRKLSRAMERGGLKWAKEDWEGIEIWKLVLAQS